MTKSGSEFSIIPVDSVSGYIRSGGSGLGGIAVRIEGQSTGFFEQVCSASNGYYLFMDLPLDTFIVSAGGYDAEDCGPDSCANASLPGFTLTIPAPMTFDVDLDLAP